MPTIEELRLLLSDRALLRGVVISLVLLVALRFFQAAATRVVKKPNWSTAEDRVRWIASIRQATFVLLVTGLLLIWGSELHSFAVSIVAIAAALVLATKELILCLTGGILRASSRSFSIGDRVEIAGHRGDVIAHGLFTTTIRELGPGHQWTGRALVLPNSMYLNTPVINETFSEQYVLHLFTVPMNLEDDWKTAERQLREAADEACGDYLEEARHNLLRGAAEQGLTPPTAEPRVTLQLPEAGKLNLLVRVPTPARSKGKVEQEILRRFIEHSTAAE